MLFPWLFSGQQFYSLCGSTCLACVICYGWYSIESARRGRLFSLWHVLWPLPCEILSTSSAVNSPKYLTDHIAVYSAKLSELKLHCRCNAKRAIIDKSIHIYIVLTNILNMCWSNPGFVSMYVSPKKSTSFLFPWTLVLLINNTQYYKAHRTPSLRPTTKVHNLQEYIQSQNKYLPWQGWSGEEENRLNIFIVTTRWSCGNSTTVESTLWSKKRVHWHSAKERAIMGHWNSQRVHHADSRKAFQINYHCALLARKLNTQCTVGFPPMYRGGWKICIKSYSLFSKLLFQHGWYMH